MSIDDSVHPETEAAIQADVVAQCADTIAMLAEHRASRPMGELAENEAQLLTQTDAIATAGGACVETLVRYWRAPSKNPWRTWAAVFAMASLEGADALVAVGRELAALPADATRHGELAAEALVVSPHPDALSLARELLRAPNPIACAAGIDILAARTQLAPEEVIHYLADTRTPVLRAAVRASRLLAADKGVPLLLPFMNHPDRAIAWPAARQLGRWKRREPYLEIRERRRLTRVLGVEALELLIQFGNASDLERFDEILLRAPVSAAHLSAVARFGHATTWAFLIHHLANPELADAAADALVTLFGPRVGPKERKNASAWRDAIARAKLDPTVRYRRGEPWRIHMVATECTDGHLSRDEIGVRLDELCARLGVAVDVDLAAWSVDVEPALRAALAKLERSAQGAWAGAWS